MPLSQAARLPSCGSGRTLDAGDYLPTPPVARACLPRRAAPSLDPFRRRRGGSPSNPYRSMDGGSVDELLDVAVERLGRDELQVEVGRTLEDGVQSGLTGDHRE